MITVDYREDIPSPPEFAALFETTGWNKTFHLSAGELKDGLQHSWYILAAYDGDHLVGFGRVLSDGAK